VDEHWGDFSGTDGELRATFAQRNNVVTFDDFEKKYVEEREDK
jgi:hypothetical protein